MLGLLKAYDFNPVSIRDLLKYEIMFDKSKIISKDIIPKIWSNLPKLRSSERIFMVNVDKEDISPMDFHDEWDEKGPTLTLIKTSNNRIYGAYSPVSWISENV